jgi:cytochrome b6-f complex iron-sulfur subunit
LPAVERIHSIEARMSLPQESTPPDRRGLLARLAGWFMFAGLASSYGACAAMAGRYLFPARGREKRWQYLARAADVAAGSSFVYRAPTGERIAVARRASAGTPEDFVALSSTCPHLGCQVHWEAQNQRFFCPCHNGAFDADGRATAGPPFEAGQELARYPLRIEEGSILIEVPIEALPRGTGERGR